MPPPLAPAHKRTALALSLAGAAAAALALSGSAQAAEVTGGASIAGAVPIPIGDTNTTVRFGTDDDFDRRRNTAHDFWKVAPQGSRQVANRRRADGGPVGPGNTLPSRPGRHRLQFQHERYQLMSSTTVRDYGAGGRKRLTFTSPGSSEYVLMAYRGEDQLLGIRPLATLAYSFNASVRHATRLVLSVPRRANRGSRIAVRGDCAEPKRLRKS